MGRARYIWLFLGLILIVLIVALASRSPGNPIPGGTPVPSEGITGEIVDLTVETTERTANFLGDLLDRLTQAPKSELARILLVVGGVLLLIAGWRIYDFIIIVAGFLIGALIAGSLVTTDNTFISLVVFLVGGLIGALLSAVLYYVAVFMIGAYLGISLTGALANALSLAPVSPLALLVGGVIGGLVLLGLSFEFLVLVSALVGAQMLTLGFGLNVVWTLIFAVVGVIVQLGLLRVYNYDFRRRRRPFGYFQRTAV